MEKLVYLCWKRGDEPLENFRAKLLGAASRKLLDGGVLSLTINVADLNDQIAESPLVLGEGRTISASVSCWMPSLDARKVIEETLLPLSAKLWGYLVTESVPLAYSDRHWPDGKKSPGVTLFTAFPRPERLTDEEFFGHWHGVHTPLSFEIHPLWQYTRNAVARALTPDAAPYRGIVEERFRELDDALDMNRLFRGAAENMKRGMKDVARFLDRERIDSTLMSEYIVKT